MTTDNVRVDDVIERLSQVGLPVDEARVYVYLSMLGASRAGDIAAATGQSRPKTYRLLEALVSRGYATATIDRPARFEAAAVSILFTDLRAALEQRVKKIDEVESEISQTVEMLRGRAQPETLRARFTVVRGREEISRILMRLADGSQERVDIILHHPAAHQLIHRFGILHKVASRSAEGPRIRLVLPQALEIPDETERYLDAPNVEVRVAELGRTMALNIFDGKELLIVMQADPSPNPRSEESVALWSDAKEFVGAQQVFFEATWRQAKSPSEAAKGASGSAKTAGPRKP